MMKKILLANIGNRNIQFGKHHIGKNNYYQETKEIYDNLEAFHDDISIHIIDSLVEEYSPDHIYLFVTNQDKPFFQDSYWVGKIIENIRSEKNISLVEIHHDPRHRDKSFQFFENFFDIHPEFENMEIIVSGSWWIPACKEALNFYSIIKYPQSIITDVDEISDTIYTSSIASEYLKNFHKRNLINMIQSYDYSSAYHYAQQHKVCSIKTIKTISYLLHRYNFDFHAAQWVHNEVRSLYPSFAIPDYTDEKMLLWELINSMLISMKKWEYALAIAKAYAFGDIIYYYLFELKTGIKKSNIEEIKKMWITLKQEIAHNNTKEFVQWYVLMKYLMQKFPHDFDVIKTNEIWNKLFWLKNIRNESYIAHWFGSVNKEDIQQIIIILSEYKQDMFPDSFDIFDTLNIIITESI